MKVIDLLNKIANGEEVPKKIRYEGREMFWCEPCKIYEVAEVKQNELCGTDLYKILDNLTDEVEIIEEEKKIPEKLKSLNNVGNVPNLVEFADKQQLNNHLLKDKLNEVIHYLQYLKSKGE